VAILPKLGCLPTRLTGPEGWPSLSVDRRFESWPGNHQTDSAIYLVNKKLHRALLLSLLGALGTGISCLFSYIERQLGFDLSLVSFLLGNGLLFIPTGTLIGLSISYFGNFEKRRVLIWSSVGGFIYGCFGTFSIFGAVAGLFFLGLCLAVIIEGVWGTPKTTWLVGLTPFLLGVLLIFSIYSDQKALNRFVFSVLFPLMAVQEAPLYVILCFSLFGYTLNFLILIMMWDKIDVAVNENGGRAGSGAVSL